MSFLVGVGDEVLLGFCLILTLVYILYQVLNQLMPDQNHQNSHEDFTRVRSSAYDCSICLGEATLAVETNCGHVYCGQCIISYYDTASRGNCQ